MQLAYDSGFLQALSDLSTITEEILLQKTENGIEVKAGDKGRTVLYHLTAPAEKFPADKNCAFHDYGRFFAKFCLFEDPQVDLNDDASVMTITSGNRSATHNLASLSVVKAPFTQVRIPSTDVEFSLTADLIKKLRELAGVNYFDANRVVFSFSENELGIVLRSTRHENTYRDKSADSIKEFKADQDFSIEFDIKALQLLPLTDYKVFVAKDGIMKLEMIRKDDISVLIYIAKVID